MWKEVLSVGAGVVVGAAICYGSYRLYGYYMETHKKEDEDVFAAKLKEKEAQEKRFDELIARQTYVDFLTAKELTNWFRENHSSVVPNAKMIIATPTAENMKGMGYSGEDDLDVDTNVVQLFYDEETESVLKIRLVNFTDIDSNLQAQLIEQDGMLVVTE